MEVRYTVKSSDQPCPRVMAASRQRVVASVDRGRCPSTAIAVDPGLLGDPLHAAPGGLADECGERADGGAEEVAEKPRTLYCWKGLL